MMAVFDFNYEVTMIRTLLMICLCVRHLWSVGQHFARKKDDERWGKRAT